MSRTLKQFAQSLRNAISQSQRRSRRQNIRFSVQRDLQLLRVERLESRELLAADFQLLKDVNTALLPTGSSPGNFTEVSGTIFFTATTPTFGTELWKTDGTSAGTVMVKDIQPGNGSSSPGSLTNLNGKLYFSANDGTTGNELWTSDGTPTGTLLVKDINPGFASSFPSGILRSGSAILFAADDGVHGRELWGSTGSSDITLMIKDINPGAASSNPSSLFNTPFQIIFSANDGSSGIELWKTDATAAGTTLLTDINPGTASSFPSNFMLVNSTTYFTATNATSGTELWSNFSSSTTLLKDIQPGTGSSNPASLVNVNGRLYFSANDGTNGTELWRSDLTTATTLLASNIRSGSVGSSPSNLTNFAGSVYFTADNGNVGVELWSYNSLFGAGLVKDINTVFTAFPGSSSPAELTVFNNLLYFSANDGTGRELWKSNGNSTETTVVSEINPTGSSSPSGIRNINGTLYFSANDGTAGAEFWKNNATTSTMIKDIASGTADSNPSNGVELNGSVLFSASDLTNGTELWKTDGTAAGTVLVKDIFSGTNSSTPRYLTNINGTLFFSARNSTGYGLWKSDGTTGGTVLLKNFLRNPRSFANVNGNLLFNASENSTGYELWRSDGTASGTVLVKDINPSSARSNPSFLTNVNGTLFFWANDGTTGYELWKSDSSNAGTVIVRDIRPGNIGSYPRYLTNANGVLFFISNDGTNGYELWKSDGSNNGTVLVKDIRSGINTSYLSGLTSVGGAVFFQANDGSHGLELWKSDGSASGTTMVRDIQPGVSSSNPGSMVNVNGVLFFWANDGTTGYELWKSDGTQIGTTLVKDLISGVNGNNAFTLSNVNGRLFFKRNSGELWTSDGTENGTVKMADLTGDSGSSSPGVFAVLNGKLILSATTESFGRELYNDLTAPQILSLSPTLTSGVVTAGDSGFTFNFTEPVFASSANFSLMSAGPDGMLGTLDDVSIPATVSSPPGNQIYVSFAGLAQDSYRVTVKSGANGLKDIAGNQLDGDFNGTEGGDYVQDFVVDQPAVQVDAAFGSAGTVISTFGSGTDEAYGVVVQPDGKIVVAGGASNGTNLDFAIARYNANGTLDTSFDNDGRQLTAVGSGDDTGFAVVLQPDGKIVVAGSSSNGSNFDIAVVRYNTDGSLDTTFDTDGKVTTAVGSLNDIAYSLAVLPDGRIVVGGIAANATDYDFALVRYNSNGSRDQSFGTDGKVTTAIGNGSDVAQGLVVQSDGKYVLTGNSFNGTNYDFSFARYLPSGALDTTFGSSGKTAVPIGSSDEGAYGLVQQPDGKIVAAGMSSNGANNDMAVVRLNYDGSLDSSFNGNGKSVFSIGISVDEARSLSLQSDGKILVAGLAVVGASSDLAIARLLSNGSLDTSFDEDGKLTLAASTGIDSVFSTSIQNDGGIVLAGFSSNATDHDFAVSRIQPTATSYSLSSVNGFTFDIDRSQQGSGQLLQGGAANAFDGVNRLRIGNVEFAPTTPSLGSTDDGGRTWVSGSFAVSGLNVTREITVPATGSQDFSRQLEVFQNTTSSAIATSVTLASNFGSNSNSTIFATSDGDTLVEPTDWWIGIDDADANSGTPAVIQILRGPFPDNLTSVTSSLDNLSWTFNLTVPPGETKRIATFTVVGATRQLAIDATNALLNSSGLQGQSTAFLTQTEIKSIANIHFAPTDILLSASSINENNSVNALVATLTSVVGNPSVGDTFTYSLVSGTGSNDNASFAISGDQLRANVPFDFETKNNYSIRVRTTDAVGAFFEKSFTINVTDVDDTPPVVSDTSFMTVGAVTSNSTTLTIAFSEAVQGIELTSNYELLRAGTDGLLGNSDDVIIPITSATFSSGTNTATLTFAGLAEDVYRLTVKDTITDQAGNALDGDNNGTAGGNWRKDFVVGLPNDASTKTLLPTGRHGQATGRFGYAVAADTTYRVVGAPFADSPNNTDVGYAYVYDAISGALKTTLRNPTPANNDLFGYSVAVSGNIVAVGAYLDDTTAVDSGSVYLFNAANGALLATIANPTPAANDLFGLHVAISGNTVVVSAVQDDTTAFDSGSVYVFDTATGALLTTIANPTPAAGDNFGSSVGVSGNTIVVGASGDDNGGGDSGSAYLFNATNGSLIATLANPTPAANDVFGSSAAISGNVVVVSAFQDDTGANDSGSAYLFNATTGALVATLVNPSPGAGDDFGYSVDVSGNTVVVGAYSDDDGGEDSGKAYLFNASSGALTATLAKPTPVSFDEFGLSVAISGGSVLVGVPYDDALENASGSVFVFDSASGTLKSSISNPIPGENGQAGSSFGYSVAVDGNYRVVGAPFGDFGSTADVGYAYVYQADTGELITRLNNPTPSATDYFGYSVAISGNLVVVGAFQDDAGAMDSGTVYLFNAISGELLRTIANPTPAVSDYFGYRVAISGNNVVVGAFQDDSTGTDSGSAYVFNATSGALVATLANPTPAAGDNFGNAVAVSGNVVVVGAYFDNTGATDSGTAYVFNATDGSLISTLSNPFPGTGDGFGKSVAISSDTVVIGSTDDDTAGANGGSAYVFSASTGTLLRTLANPTPAEADDFGVSVAVYGNTIVVGSNLDDTTASDGGSAYVFNSTTGALVATLANPSPSSTDLFGYSVAISPTSILVGAFLDDESGINSGGAYVFDTTTGILQTELANPIAAAGDLFGNSVSVSDNFVVVGAPFDNSGAIDSGLAYIFDATTGERVASLSNPTPAANDWFGFAVAVSGNIVVVGARLDDTGASDSGVAYVFDATTGALLATLANPTPAAGDNFGYSVSVSGNLAVVGAIGDDAGATDSGTAYVFNATSGALIATLSNPFPAAGNLFGSSIAISGTAVVVGAPFADAVASSGGVAYVFNATTGAPISTLSNPTPSGGDFFGSSVAISGSLVVVGAREDDAVATDSGAAYIFDSSTGTLLSTLTSPSHAANDLFGRSVSISNSIVAVGALNGAGGAANSGWVYVFNANSSDLRSTITNPTPATNDQFAGVAVSGNTIVVGASLDDTANLDAGAAYIFTAETNRSFIGPNGHSFFVAGSSRGAGQLVQGSDNAFDGLNRLQIGGADFVPGLSSLSRLDDGDRTIVTPVVTLSNLDVSREVTVPSTGAQDFARTLDVFSNPTGSAITVPVRLVGNLGSDAATTVFATSDGDLLVEPTDLWFGTDDGDGVGAPAVVHLLHAGFFGIQPGALAVTDDNVDWTFSLTVNAGQTKRLATFTVLGDTRADAIASINELVGSNGFLGEAATFLTANELASIANFQFNQAPTDIQLSSTSIAENNGVNALVATLLTVDPNLSVGDTHTYALVGGPGSTDNGSFTIVGNELRAKLSFDFETKSSYSIRIRSTDAEGASLDRNFTIQIVNLDEVPPTISAASFLASGIVPADSTSLSISFSESVVGADIGTNYELRRAGADGLLGNSDDPIITITSASYSNSTNTATLNFGGLLEDVYRLTAMETIFDVAGNALDGDANGSASGNWRKDFVVDTRQSGLDPLFGQSGKVTTDVGSLNDYAESVALQSDGKVVVAGSWYNGTDSDFAIVRYNVDGTLDPTFDGDGVLTTAIGSSDDYAQGVAIQSDGKIVVVGYSFSSSEKFEFALVRYNANGSLDTSFDGDGKLTTSIGSTYDVAIGLALQSDGRIVVAGTSRSVSNYDFALARYNVDGTLDSTFDGDGRLTTAIASSDDSAISLAVQSDGKIVVAGHSIVSNNYDFALARYNIDGTLDLTFDGDGKLTTTIDSSDDIVVDLALQSDGKIIVAGHSGSGDNVDFAVARYNVNGTLDATFDGDGKLTTAIGSSADAAGGVAVQGDGKIIVVGSSLTGNFFHSALARYNVNGTLDTTFGEDGKLTSSTLHFASDLALQSDGKIVVAGYASNGQNTDFALARYNVDRTFVELLSSSTLNFEIDRSETGSGQLMQGPTSAFDGLNRMQVAGVGFVPTGQLGTMADVGHSLVLPSVLLAGLSTSRKVSVPSTGSQDFARTIEVFSNPTGSAITVPVEIVGNLGSDAATTVFATSDGDTIVEPTDLWFGTDDDNATGGTPAIVHLLHGPRGLVPLTVGVIDDNVQWTYNLTVGPGETKRLASFTILGNTRQQAIDSVNALINATGFSGQAAAFLINDELASLANFQFNAAPTDVQLGPNSIAENNPLGAAVGTLTTTDANITEGDSHTYILVPGDGDADNAEFSILGNQLLANSSFNFENKFGYTVRVRTTDQSGLSFEKSLIVGITNVNEAPMSLQLQSGFVMENQPSGAPAGNFLSVDQDQGDILFYQLVPGIGSDDNSNFTLDGTGALHTNSSFDYESKHVFLIRVRVTDLGGLSLESSFPVTVGNVNEFGSIDVQNGLAERSYIRNVDLIFEDSTDLNQLVTGNRIRVTRFDLNGNNPTLQTTPAVSPVGNRLLLDFGIQGVGGNRNSNIGDGYYQIAVDEDGNGSFDTFKYFYRLLGDTNGDLVVDSRDSKKVLGAQGRLDANADINGDGVVNVMDTMLTGRAMNRRLKDGLWIDD